MRTTPSPVILLLSSRSLFFEVLFLLSSGSLAALRIPRSLREPHSSARYHFASAFSFAHNLSVTPGGEEKEEQKTFLSSEDEENQGEGFCDTENVRAIFLSHFSDHTNLQGLTHQPPN